MIDNFKIHLKLLFLKSKTDAGLEWRAIFFNRLKVLAKNVFLLTKRIQGTWTIHEKIILKKTEIHWKNWQENCWPGAAIKGGE